MTNHFVYNNFNTRLITAHFYYSPQKMKLMTRISRNYAHEKMSKNFIKNSLKR